MLRDLLSREKDTSVYLGVKNALIVAFWMPVVMVLWAVGIAALGLSVRLAMYGDLPELGEASAIDPSLLVLGAVGALGYFYLLLANETFGSESVETAKEQADDFKDMSDD